MASPNSYKDPYWSLLASNAEEKTGIPTGLLTSIIQNGEKSNADQVSEAGAKTVFQIIPATHKAILNKYGIDTYLSPENAAEGAALLLKESLDRNKGDVSAAVAEYHGGTNRRNWGPRTNAYVNRVVGGVEPLRVSAISKDLDAWLAGQPTSVDEQINQVKQISTGMDASAQSGTEQTTAVPAPDANATEAAPDVSGMLADFDQWQATQKAPEQPKPDLGFFGGIQEAITGEQRSTETSRTLPEWTGMPELNELSLASAKTGLGTIFASPDEIVQVIKSNYPDAQIRQDEKGNYVIKSSIDAQDYVIPPGITMGDLPRIIGGIAAFTPAGRAVSTLGMAGARGLAAQAATGGAAAAATQAAIEGTQAATGGDFGGKDVALTGLLGAALPGVIKGVETVGGLVANPIKGALNKVRGTEAAPAQAAARAGDEPIIMGATGEYTVPNVGASVAAANAPEKSLQELAQTAVKAGKGGIGSKNATETMVEMAAPDPKVVGAAKRLGMLDDLQADHVTTSQVFREVSQAIKSGIGSKTREADLLGLQRAAKRADDLITELGGTDDLASVSQNVKNGLQETHDTLKSRAQVIYDEIDTKLVKTGSEAPAPNTLAFIEARAKTLGGTEHLTLGERRALKALSPKDSKQPTYGLLDQTRKQIGAAKRGAQNAFVGADVKTLGDLESVLRSDQASVARAAGFGEKWEAAQGYAKTYKGLENDLVALFGDALDQSIVGKLGTAVNALPKGDTSKFIKLIKLVPPDMRQEVVASGLASAFGKQQSITFNSYAQWYEGLLKNKQAHAAIMTNLPPSARKSLSDLYRVSNGIAKSSKERITTGRLNDAKDAFTGGETLAGKIYDAALRQGASEAIGVISPRLGFIAKLITTQKTPPLQAADKLFASPDFHQAVMMAANGKAKPAAEKLAKSKVFNEFVFKIGNPGELSNRERWILQALEANNQQVVNSR